MLKKDKSEALTKEFNKYYPGGHSNLRIPMDVTEHRLFIAKSEGTHLTDVDGNEYIEYNGSMGPNILGHSHPEFTKRIVDYLKNNGSAIGSNLLFSPMDVEVAKLIEKYVPCAEEIKFTTTGSEAVQAAFRIARAYTGKTVIVRFAGSYAGWCDNVLGGRINPNKDEIPYTDYTLIGGPEVDPYYTEGRVPWVNKETFLIPWNDFDALEETFEKYHDLIAAIHFEGIVWNHDGLYPKPGFLERIRELCDQYNIVMSMDEVITGFRVNIGGAQKVLGVTPDICTMGKAISNGIPVSCVAGKKKIMDVIRGNKVLVPGTYPGYGLGMAAVLATIDLLTRDNCAVYDKVFKVQEKIMDGLVEISNKYDIPLTITEANGVFSTIFGVPGGRRRLYTDEDLKGFDKELCNNFQRYMQENGVFLMFGGRWYINASHTMEDAEKTLIAADKSMKALKENNYKFIVQ
ncbi:aspartate aminotransferase family protein [uncultured Clostridium sp.]|uniref:aspartate aminotransferase family protein n=1 Tax=uncultured Clostridium sp. TaxID=59620 RepID=UPI0025D6357A|nr:aminotransferase class III-fold pyridoxal phosphate-dependent enzyme [uncultured Clostridium sp.]